MIDIGITEVMSKLNTSLGKDTDIDLVIDGDSVRPMNDEMSGLILEGLDLSDMQLITHSSPHHSTWDLQVTEAELVECDHGKTAVILLEDTESSDSFTLIEFIE
jgi:hypothetical protein